MDRFLSLAISPLDFWPKHPRWLIGMFLHMAFLLAGASPVSAQSVTFSDERIGVLPKNFETVLTGQGQRGRWEVIEDNMAIGGRALAQLSADSTDDRFPLAIYTPTRAANVEITTQFKPVSGTVDQAGGVVVRFVDPNNYYVARANALEDNVRFYRVVAGRRQELASANVKVAPMQWHTLTLRAEGDQFAVSFDGKLLHTTIDKTFSSPGRVGLWTKSDSVTHFDRVEIKALP